MSVASILTTLGTLEKMHKSLFELAMTKTELIKVGDMEQLDQLLKNEQAHVAAIEKLEQQRQSVVAAYFQAQGKAPTAQLTVTDVIEEAKTDQEKQQLTAIRERLMDLLARLKERNDLNQKLVFQSLQFVNLSMEMMRPQQPNAINYTGEEVRGQNQVGKKSYFDSQI